MAGPIDNVPESESSIPSWVFKIGSLGGLRSLIRGVIFRPIVKGIVGVASSFISAILLLGRGSDIGLEPQHAVWGIEDVFLFFAGIAVDLGTWAITTFFDVLISLNWAIVPATPGPIDGFVVYAFLSVELIVLGELARRGFRALLDSLPVASGLDDLLFGG